MILHEGIDLAIFPLLNFVNFVLSLELEVFPDDLHFLFILGMEFLCPPLKVRSVFSYFLVMLLDQVLDDVLMGELIFLQLDFERPLVFFQLFFLGEVLLLFERDGLFRVCLEMGDVVLVLVEEVFYFLFVDLLDLNGAGGAAPLEPTESEFPGIPSDKGYVP